MDPKRRFGIRRFASSAVIALLVTVALLFLMTRLILPGEHDRIVTRMIQNVEFHRADRPRDPTSIPTYQRPPPVEVEPPPTQPTTTAEGSNQTPNEELLSDDLSEEEIRAHVIDWWAAAHKLTEKSDEAALKQWLLEQGFERYVSIMQGPLPITNSVQVQLPPSQEDATGYMNSYGSMEYKISENCVATTQVAARLDQSDFSRKLPMIITCKRGSAKQKLSFDRHDRE